MGFLGSLIIDLVLLLFLVVIIIYSVRKGFSGSTWGIVSSVLAIGGAFALGFIIYTFLFGLFGWVEGLENTIDSWLGGTSTLLEAFEGMGFDYDAVVKYTAMGLCIVLLFIPF